MMVAWSRHTGARDRSGDGAIRYFKDAFSMKRGPGGKLIREERNPPPEILRGHPDLVRRAINSLATKHVYASGVLSFHQDDIDVAAFNRRDPALRQKIDRLMDEFEDVMFRGIPKDMRPPLFWTTHTHTGRLELNVLAPRFVYSGRLDPANEGEGAPSGKVLAYNPHPPGEASRATYDAFRRLWNVQEGWADPDDDSRKQIIKRPDHEVKQERAAERMCVGQGTGKHPSLPADHRSTLHDRIAARVEAGWIKSRRQLLTSLREWGYRINRTGKDYISVETVDPARNARASLPVIEKSIRLKGPLYSEAFTDPVIAMVWLSDKGQSEGQLRALEQKRRDARKAETEAIRQRLDDLLRERETFNQKRYGGPAWEPKPAPSLVLDQTFGPIPYVLADPWPFDRPRASARMLSRAAATKVRLWESLYDVALPYDVAVNIRYVDTERYEVRFYDGSVVTDYGRHLTGKGNNQTLARVMALESKAKGWITSELNGPEEFLRASVRESIKLGLIVFGADAEAERIVAEEWERLAGEKRESPGEQHPNATQKLSVPKPAPKPEAEKLHQGNDFKSVQQSTAPALADPASSTGRPAQEKIDAMPSDTRGSEQHLEQPVSFKPPKPMGVASAPDNTAHRDRSNAPPTSLQNFDGTLIGDATNEDWEQEDEWNRPQRRDDLGPGM